MDRRLIRNVCSLGMDKKVVRGLMFCNTVVSFLWHFDTIPEPPPPYEGSRSHSDTPHSVGLLSTSVQPDTLSYTCTGHNTYKRQTFMPPAGFEPADSCLSPRGHWDRQYCAFVIRFKNSVFGGSRRGKLKGCVREIL